MEPRIRVNKANLPKQFIDTVVTLRIIIIEVGSYRIGPQIKTLFRVEFGYVSFNKSGLNLNRALFRLIAAVGFVVDDGDSILSSCVLATKLFRCVYV